jgi:hypothetical protein
MSIHTSIVFTFSGTYAWLNADVRDIEKGRQIIATEQPVSSGPTAHLQEAYDDPAS